MDNVINNRKKLIEYSDDRKYFGYSMFVFLAVLSTVIFTVIGIGALTEDQVSLSIFTLSAALVSLILIFPLAKFSKRNSTAVVKDIKQTNLNINNRIEEKYGAIVKDSLFLTEGFHGLRNRLATCTNADGITIKVSIDFNEDKTDVFVFYSDVEMNQVKDLVQA